MKYHKNFLVVGMLLAAGLAGCAQVKEGRVAKAKAKAGEVAQSQEQAAQADDQQADESQDTGIDNAELLAFAAQASGHAKALVQAAMIAAEDCNPETEDCTEVPPVETPPEEAPAPAPERPDGYGSGVGGGSTGNFDCSRFPSFPGCEKAVPKAPAEPKVDPKKASFRNAAAGGRQLQSKLNLLILKLQDPTNPADIDALVKEIERIAKELSDKAASGGLTDADVQKAISDIMAAVKALIGSKTP
jgi:hypothetical protein